MENKWFEDDLTKWASNLKDLSSTQKHAQRVLEEAQKRLDQNLGNRLLGHDSSGFSGLDISYSKHQERRKLNEVIYIVENYINNGSFTMPPYKEFKMKTYSDEYNQLKELMASLIEPDIVLENCPSELEEALMTSIAVPSL